MKYLDMSRRWTAFRLSYGFKESALTGVKLAGSAAANVVIFAGKTTVSVAKQMPEITERMRQEQEKRKK